MSDLTNTVRIDWKDLLMKILLQWKKIVLFALAGALLLGLVGAILAYRQEREQEGADAGFVTEEQIIQLKAELSEVERLEAESAFDTYKRYYDNYQILLSHRENSQKMNLSPEQSAKGEVWYRIDNHYQVQYPIINEKNNISDITFSYVLLFDQMELYENMLSSLGLDTSAEYLQELISAEVGENTESGIFCVSVVAENEAVCASMLNIIEQEIQEKTSALQQLYGDFQIEQFDRQIVVGTNYELLQWQQNQIETIYDASHSFQELDSHLSDSQEAYYDALVQAYMQDQETNSEDGNLPAGDLTDQTATYSLLNVRYIVFGAFLGGLLVCIIVAIRYMFDSRLRLVEDAGICYKAPVLGTLTYTPLKDSRIFSFVDRWIYSFLGEQSSSTLSNEAEMQMIVAKLQAIFAGGDVSQVCFSSSIQDAECEMIRKSLVEKMQESGIPAAENTSALAEPAAFKEIVEAKYVCFVERLNCSNYNQLKEMEELCRQYQIGILGCVVLK